MVERDIKRQMSENNKISILDLFREQPVGEIPIRCALQLLSLLRHLGDSRMYFSLTAIARRNGYLSLVH